MKCLLIAALAATLAACATTPNPITPGTNTDAYGHLISGEKFGAAIGRPATNVQAALWDGGYGYQGIEACTAETAALFACREGDTFLRFQPAALDRKGAVYLKIEAGRVAAIGWDLKYVPALEG
jgi:hypothetical protein